MVSYLIGLILVHDAEKESGTLARSLGMHSVQIKDLQVVFSAN